MEKRREQEKEKLQSILRIAKETESIAQNTCLELKDQDVTINRITDKSLQVSQNIDKSERIVKGMSSFFGRVKNFFSKPKPTEIIPKVEPLKTNLERIKEKSETPQPNKAVYCNQDEEDKYLDEIINSVDNIKSMAVCISDTLDSQNKKLDDITGITDRNTSRLDKLNYKAKKLLV